VYRLQLREFDSNLRCKLGRQMDMLLQGVFNFCS